MFKHTAIFLNGIILLFLALLLSRYFQDKVPAFGDYPVLEKQSKKTFLSISPKNFPKELPEKERQKIFILLQNGQANFAGNFILFDLRVDSLTKVVMIYSLKKKAFIENLNIKEVYLPRAYKRSFERQFKFEYYPDSTLIRIEGLPENEEEEGVYYYYFDGKEFGKKAFFPWKKQ